MIVSALDDADEQACERKKSTYGSPRESCTCGIRPSAGARPTCGVPAAQRVHVSGVGKDGLGVPLPRGGRGGRLTNLMATCWLLSRLVPSKMTPKEP